MQNLKINKIFVKTISAIVTIEISAVGRALFMCEMDSVPNGTIEYSIDSHTIFIGYVEKVQRVAPRVYKIHARELSAIFELNAPISIRNAPLKSCVDSLVKQSLLPIVTQVDATWQNIKVPHFICLGSGFLAIDNIAIEARLKMPIYNLLNNGLMFLGDYPNSPFDKQLTLPEKMFIEVSPIMATLPMIPTLKVGNRLEIPDGQTFFIEKIDYVETQMRLYFSLNPWQKL